MKCFALADIGTSSLLFKNANELLKVKSNPQFSLILARVKCLDIVVEANGDEVSQLIDMVNDLKVGRKHLLLIVPALDLSVMKNKTINYNVMIYDRSSGNIILAKINCICKFALFVRLPVVNHSLSYSG